MSNVNTILTHSLGHLGPPHRLPLTAPAHLRQSRQRLHLQEAQERHGPLLQVHCVCSVCQCDCVLGVSCLLSAAHFDLEHQSK